MPRGGAGLFGPAGCRGRAGLGEGPVLGEGLAAAAAILGLGLGSEERGGTEVASNRDLLLAAAAALERWDDAVEEVALEGLW